MQLKCRGLQSRKGNAIVTLDSSGPHSGGQSASPLRVHSTPTRDFPLGAANGIAYMANRVDQRRFTELFPEPADEHLNELGIVFVRMLPHAFAQLCAREHAARFPH